MTNAQATRAEHRADHLRKLRELARECRETAAAFRRANCEASARRFEARAEEYERACA